MRAVLQAFRTLWKIPVALIHSALCWQLLAQERPPGRGTPNPSMDVINSKAKKQSFTVCFDKVFELSFRTLDAFLVYINTCTPSRLKHPHDVTVSYCGFASTSQNLVPHLENHYQPKLHLSHGRPEPTWIFRLV